MSITLPTLPFQMQAWNTLKPELQAI